MSQRHYRRGYTFHHVVVGQYKGDGEWETVTTTIVRPRRLTAAGAQRILRDAWSGTRGMAEVIVTDIKATKVYGGQP